MAADRDASAAGQQVAADRAADVHGIAGNGQVTAAAAGKADRVAADKRIPAVFAGEGHRVARYEGILAETGRRHRIARFKKDALDIGSAVRILTGEENGGIIFSADVLLVPGEDKLGKGSRCQRGCQQQNKQQAEQFFSLFHRKPPSDT